MKKRIIRFFLKIGMIGAEYMYVKINNKKLGVTSREFLRLVAYHLNRTMNCCESYFKNYDNGFLFIFMLILFNYLIILFIFGTSLWLAVKYIP